MKKIGVAGSLVLDILPIFPEGTCGGQLLAEGKVTECNGVCMYPGGEVGNTGLALSRLGEQVELFSKVGNDTAGEAILSLLGREKAGVYVQQEKGMRSTVSIALALPGRDKSTIHSRGASQTLTADDIPTDFFQGLFWFHFGYPTSMESLYRDGGKELLRLLNKAKSSGAGISMDMSLPDLNTDAGKVRWRPILKEILPLVDLFLPSAEETLFMLEYDRYREMALRYPGEDLIGRIEEKSILEMGNDLLSMGCGGVLIKCGKKGMYFRTASAFGRVDGWQERELWRLPVKAKRMVSATGAGDTAIAGFLSGFLRGECAETALQAACK